MSFLVDTKIQINGYLRFEDNWKMFLYDATLSACVPTSTFRPSLSFSLSQYADILISVHSNTHTQQFMIGKHKYTIKFSFSSHKKQIIWNWNCFFIIITYVCVYVWVCVAWVWIICKDFLLTNKCECFD
jgi:hypothetical protein